MRKILLFCFLLGYGLSVVPIMAQERQVSGIVTDAADNSPLPGVTVLLKGTTSGTVTDFNGEYNLSVPGGATLVFTFIGYTTKEVEVGSQTEINIMLESGTLELQEVVVTGYSTFTKEKAAIAAGVVDSKTIENRPNASIVQTLTGQIAGMSITTTSGQPGANSTIQIRGVGSIQGNYEPLFILDGAPVHQDNIRALNPNDIASVTVLKDAGATAVYGNRGANGVIIYVTKSGNYDSELQVNYSYQSGIGLLQRSNYDPMNAQEQLYLEREKGIGRGAGMQPDGRYSYPDGTPSEPMTDAEIEAAPNFDWVDYFFRPSRTNSHNLSLSRGGKQSHTYLSVNYLDQEGILRQSDLNRGGLRVNHSGSSNDGKLSYQLNTAISFLSSNEPNQIGSGSVNRNYVLGAFQSLPYMTPDEYTGAEDLVKAANLYNTPLFLEDRLRTYTNRNDEFRNILSLESTYEILKGLKFTGRVTYDYIQTTSLRSEPSHSFNALVFAQRHPVTGELDPYPGNEQQTFDRDFQYNMMGKLNYQKTLAEKHNLSASLFSEAVQGYANGFGYSAKGLTIMEYFPGAGSAYVGDQSDNDLYTDGAYTGINKYGLLSYFGVVTYDYNAKYGGKASFRADASSRFVASHKWGKFYSFSAFWNIYKEAFMDGLSQIDLLKLRLSTGSTGNQDVTGGGNYSGQLLALPVSSSGGAYNNSIGWFTGNYNEDLSWEVVQQHNVGVDLEMWQGRLVTNLDVYNKISRELYFSKPTSAITGGWAFPFNGGDLSNAGVELNVQYMLLRPEKTNGLGLKAKFVGNYNRSKILSFSTGEDEIEGIGRVGGKLGEYKTYRYAGVNPSNGNLLFLTADGEVTENPNTDTDDVYLGKNIYPDVQGSFGLEADYKGFYLTAQFNYAVGSDRLDGDLLTFYEVANIGNFRTSRDLLRAWTPENPYTDIPSIYATNNTFSGDRFLRNADYVMLRNVGMGYNIPSVYSQKLNISRARVFFNAENLITFSSWRGFDVTQMTNASRIYPTPKIWTLGVDISL